jgi:hypothetical protein
VPLPTDPLYGVNDQPDLSWPPDDPFEGVDLEPVLTLPDDVPLVQPEKIIWEENESAEPQHVFRGRYNRVGNTFVRTVLVPWEGHEERVAAILGSVSWDGDGHPFLSRYLPMSDFKQRNAYAVDVQVIGYGYRGPMYPSDLGLTGTQAPFGSGSKYRIAILTITFANLPYLVGNSHNPADPAVDLKNSLGMNDPMHFRDRTQQLGADPTKGEWQRYCTKEVRPGKEEFNRFKGEFVWADDPNNSPTFNTPIMLPFEDITVTCYDWPTDAIPAGAIQECEGKINASSGTQGDENFHLPDFPPPEEYVPETIALITHHTSPRRFLSDGTEVCDLTYFYKRRHVPIYDKDGNPTGQIAGWNHVPKQNGVWTRLVRKGSPINAGPYQTSNKFPLLFVPGS